MLISGKIAVVIGGAKGTGRACCQALVDKGAKLCVGDICDEDGKALVEHLNSGRENKVAVYATCDAASETDMKGMFELASQTFGGQVEICFNIAGMLNEDNWQKSLDVNISGNVHLVNIAREHMGRNNGRKGGVLVVMASMGGLRPRALAPVYCASKHAVIGLFRTWAMDAHFKSHGIRMNTVCPSAIDSDFLTNISTSTYYVDPTLATKSSGERLPTSFVAEAFIRAVEEDAWNGQTIRVTKTYGIDLFAFPDQPTQ